jgi:hypothetical protein
MKKIYVLVLIAIIACSPGGGGMWIDPTSLDDAISNVPGSDEVGGPMVAANSNGDAIVVWNDRVYVEGEPMAVERIFASQYINGQWQHPVSVQDQLSVNSVESVGADVGIDDDGNAIVVWAGSTYQNVGVGIFMAEYRQGVWHKPENATDIISPSAKGSQPSVAVSKNGDAVIVWVAQNSPGSPHRIYKSEFRNNTWIHPSSLNDFISPPNISGGVPRVAIDASGNSIIAYRGNYEQNNGTTNVFLSEYRNGAWTHASGINSGISIAGDANGYQPSVTMDDNGNAIVAWHQYDGNLTVQVYKSEYRNNTWTHPSDVNDNISLDIDDGENGVTYSSPAPSVAMDNNGNAVILWKQFVNDGNCPNHSAIFLSEYRNGTWVHPSSCANVISGGLVHQPTVDMDNNGNTIVVWKKTVNSAGRLFRSEYRDGSWAHPANDADYFSLNQGNTYGASLAMDEQGDAIIAFIHSGESELASPSYSKVFLSEYR